MKIIQFTVLLLIFGVSVNSFGQNLDKVAKFNSTGGTINSQIFDNNTVIGFGTTSALSGEYVSIQKHQNAWTALRIYNSQTGPSASSALAVTAGGGAGIGVGAYNTGYTSSGIYEAGAGVVNAGGSGGLNIGTTTNYQLSLWTNNAKRLSIDNTGKVGIGTATPQEKLSVDNGNVLVSGVGNWGAAGNKAYLYMGDFTQYISAQHSSGIKIGTGTYPDLLCILQSGKVSIGLDPNNGNQPITTPGNHRLYVNGGILTDDILVASYSSTQWADYVFNSDYKLRSLSEVESFVMKNKHLPEVPSACEIEDKGFSLPQMDATLLKKIEELTLYLIQINDKVLKLEKENEVLKQQLIK
jgi:hypothetical protein